MIKNLAISGTEYPYKPLDELFGTAEMLGIKNLELWIPHNFNYRDVEYLGEVLEKKGMNAVVISTWTQLNLPGDVAPRQSLIIHSIKAAKVLGAKFVNTYFGGN